MWKYGMSLCALSNGKWCVKTGYTPESSVPCMVTHKLVTTQNHLISQITNMSTTFDKDADFQIDLEAGLEISQEKIDAKAELKNITDNASIPDEFKNDIIDCLSRIPDLYTGHEFSDKTVPEDLYVHDVEFHDEQDTTLNARPYPVSGIRLDQLKLTIDEMVKNKILLPGDTDTVSPVFFVTKKPSPGKTASLGRLVFDYRKLNDKVKPLHFQ